MSKEKGPSTTANDKEFAVKVFTTALEYDYKYPWKAPTIERWTGSGFVIDGQKLITNAHVAGGSIFVEVELANDSVKYPAKLKAVGDECDLAMLEVEDPEFWEKTKALRIGDTPRQMQKVAVHGFPIGGEGYCITTGKVSRIETDFYAHGEQRMLSTQVSAPINAGNSGGAVLDKQKLVVGVVHQSLRGGQNIGYMIPADILKHFIRQVRTKNMGFPSLNLETQTLENPYIREKYGMQEHQNGILLRGIPALSCAKDHLQENDVILQINGIPVNNDGSVRIKTLKHVDYRYLINSSKMGDKITFKVLRAGKEVDVSFVLTDTFSSTHSVIPRAFGKQPSYFIMAGSIVIQPVSKNLQTDWSKNYTNQAKTNKSDQILVINSVLKNQYSHGYEGFAGEIIDKINGVEVSDMQKLIEVITSNNEKCHFLETRSGKQLVIPNLSYAKSMELLRTYNIDHPCSNDLKTASDEDNIRAELNHVQVQALQFTKEADEEKQNLRLTPSFMSHKRHLSASF
jgi:S1-C subfamily serine protease